jgi:hypothetical protein
LHCQGVCLLLLLLLLLLQGGLLLVRLAAWGLAALTYVGKRLLEMHWSCLLLLRGLQS